MIFSIVPSSGTSWLIIGLMVLAGIVLFTFSLPLSKEDKVERRILEVLRALENKETETIHGSLAENFSLSGSLPNSSISPGPMDTEKINAFLESLYDRTSFESISLLERDISFPENERARVQVTVLTNFEEGSGSGGSGPTSGIQDLDRGISSRWVIELEKSGKEWLVQNVTYEGRGI